MKSKFLNVIRPFSLELWIGLGVGWFVLSVVMALFQRTQQWLGMDLEQHPSFLYLFGVVFAEIK